jgi:aryl-alcohol dehydrogenase-like predicted oxidoreductase
VHYDYADILLLGLWNKPVAHRILDAARKLRERGLVRYLAVSPHTRKLVPAIAAARDFDLVHFRYNAAHPGAGTDIFPHLVWSKNSICLNPIVVAAEPTIPGKAFQEDVTQRYTVHI